MFGERLRNMRNKKGISQSELAKKVFVSQQTVWQWENGKAFPQMDRLSAIASSLNTSSLSLLHDNIEKKNTITINYRKELQQNIQDLALSPREYQICIKEAKKELRLSDMEFEIYKAWRQTKQESDIPFWALLEYKQCQSAVSGKDIEEFIEARAAWRRGGEEEVAKHCAEREYKGKPCLPKEFSVAYSFMMGLVSEEELKEQAKNYPSLKEYLSEPAATG